MRQIFEAEKQPTKESSENLERKRKEKEWDDIWNEGGEGYNPYRSPERPQFEPYYKGDENPE